VGVRFDGGARKAIDVATILKEERSDPSLLSFHLLYGLLAVPNGATERALDAVGGSPDKLRVSVKRALDQLTPTERSGGRIDMDAAELVLRRANEESILRGSAEVTDADILLAVLLSSAAKLLNAHGVDRVSVLVLVAEMALEQPAAPAPTTRRISKPTALPKVRTGIGYDSHRFAEGGPLVLGGIRIPADVHLAGHSDGDAVLHALTDAILGAAAAGDIGTLFPDTDPRHKGRDSVEMLKAAVALIGDLGLRVTQVDITILAEWPKVGPWRQAMRGAIADALELTPDEVGLKGKTNEGMGWVGRREGIAVMAVASLEPVSR
jgi:2-C-methyl-D-erythritol 2,4-cyclodiphosphate synthase